MHKVEEVAKYVIQRCNETGKVISNLKLQKILYFLQAEFLVRIDKPCFAEEIEALDFGPVVPSVYRRYIAYGSANIPFVTDSVLGLFARAERELLDGIIDQCAGYSSASLTQIAHNQTPWKEAYRPYCNTIIPNEKIKKYFEN